MTLSERLHRFDTGIGRTLLYTNGLMVPLDLWLAIYRDRWVEYFMAFLNLSAVLLVRFALRRRR